jgi:hypothetical protein
MVLGRSLSLDVESCDKISGDDHEVACLRPHDTITMAR